MTSPESIVASCQSTCLLCLNCSGASQFNCYIKQLAEAGSLLDEAIECPWLSASQSIPISSYLQPEQRLEESQTKLSNTSGLKDLKGTKING